MIFLITRRGYIFSSRRTSTNNHLSAWLLLLLVQSQHMSIVEMRYLSFWSESLLSPKESPNTKHGVLFPVMQWIPVEIDDNPNRSFIVRFLYSTLDTAIACILHMQDYSTFEMAEVVSRLPRFRLFCLSLLFYNDFSVAPQVIARVWRYDNALTFSTGWK